MSLLVLGLLLFLGTHTIPVVAPRWRQGMIARLGEAPFKGLYALASLVGFVFIIWGFAKASTHPALIYTPALGARRITAALMPFALILAVASVLPPGRIKRWVRHPLLIGTILFAVGHLLANGDLAGIILFGAFLLWAIVDLASAFRWSPATTPAGGLSTAGDVAAIVAGLVLYGLLVWRLHYWLFGVSPMV